MSAEPPPNTSDTTSLTRLFSQIQRGRGRHSAPATLDRWVIWLISGAAFVVVLAIGMLVIGGGDEEQTRPPVVAAPSTAEPEVTEPEVTDEPSASPTVVLTPRRTTRPGDIIVALQATVTNLVRDGQLSRDDGRRLNNRLKDANQALAKGEVDNAWDELKDFSEKISDLREDDELSRSGYQTLTAGLQQLMQVLPRGR